MSTVEGLHNPDTPLSEVEGSEGTTPPVQMVRAVPKLNVGIVFGVTATENVVGSAHTPAVGVNV